LPLPRLALATLSALALLLSACQNLVQTPRPPVEALAGTGELLEARPGETRQVKVRLAQGAEGAQVYLRLADPCAKGTATCPGWDATRYPGVEHTRERFTLTATSPEATFTLSVAQDALPQGPFKWELVAVDQGGREWTFPVYLRIRRPQDEPPLQVMNRWRAWAGLGLFSREDPERAFGCWQYGRYIVLNRDSIHEDPPHSANPSRPFYTPEGALCAATSSLVFLYENPNNLRTPEEIMKGYFAAPFHRVGFFLDYPEPLVLWFAQFRLKDGNTVISEIPLGKDAPLARPKTVLFPVPDKEVPLDGLWGEWPSPLQACNASGGEGIKPPYRNQEGVWRSPVGLPLSVVTSAPFQEVETEATYARLTRLSDGAELPVCAFGSRQFWNEDTAARNVGVWALKNYGAIFVVPKDPLQAGEAYEAEVRGVFGGENKTFTWRFRVSPDPIW